MDISMDISMDIHIHGRPGYSVTSVTEEFGTTDFEPIPNSPFRVERPATCFTSWIYIVSAYDIRSNLGLSIKFDLRFNVKFLVNTVSGFRRRADVARCPCHKVSPCRSRTKNDGSLIITERIFLRIVIGSKILL